MSAVSVNTPFPIFTDIDGQPLEDGYVWIGVNGLEPQANPQTAYWDAALTQVVTQPVRTRGGYPLNGTAIGQLFTADPHSVKVQNRHQTTIALDLFGAGGAGVESISFGTTGLTPAVATDGDVVVAGTLAVANGGTGVTTATGTGSVVLSASPTITGPTISSGNLAFSGTAQRITGDMSSTPQANRVLFQTSVVNGNTVVGALPNGTATTAGFISYNTNDPANASVLITGAFPTETRIWSAGLGTGAVLPLSMFVGGAEQARFGGSSSMQSLGSFATGVPVTVNATTKTVAVTEYALRFTTTNCTVTLPSASTFTGRILLLSTVTANSVTSNASNVVPLGSSTAGTAILAATAGKFAMLQSDGSLWYTLMAN